MKVPVLPKQSRLLAFLTALHFLPRHRGHPDPTQWPKQVITPPNGKLSVTTADETKFVLSDLLPNKQYFLMIHVRVKKSDEEVIRYVYYLSV